MPLPSVVQIHSVQNVRDFVLPSKLQEMIVLPGIKSVFFVYCRYKLPALLVFGM